MKYYLSILFLIVCSSLVSAQELSFGEVNRRSLAYYYAQNWKALIALGDSALVQDFDYYILRYRLGIAYYESGNYWKSQRHFEKAYALNNEDPYLREYLYYSYLFSGNEGNALFFAKNMEDTLQQKIGISRYKLLDYINVEGGAKLSSNRDSLSTLGYLAIGFGQQLGYHWKIYHELSFIGQDYKGLNYNQYEYYLRGNGYMGKSWELIPAFRYLGVRGQGAVTIENNPSQIVVGEQNYRELGLVGYLGLSKQHRRWKFNIHTAYMYRKSDNFIQLDSSSSPTSPPPVQYSFIQHNHFVQYGLGAKYMIPIGQQGLVLGADLLLKQDFQASQVDPIWLLGIDYWHGYRWGVSLSFLSAKTNTFLEKDAAIFNNITGDIDYRIHIALRYSFSPNISIYGLYQYEKRYEAYFNFKYNTFLLGLNIKL
ncbi:MAG: hypothetical protein MK212_04875 [Saprospiraceae bacterium]|nr:hypothetical protein [Saprospiraceae bacterium]